MDNMKNRTLNKIIILYSVLLAFGIYPAINNFKYNEGIDFYQFLGVGTAKKLSSGALKSPYTDVLKYKNSLD